MRLTIPLATCVLSLALSVGCKGAGSGGGGGNISLKTEEQKSLYVLGLTLGRNITPFHLSKEELEIVKKGLSDQINGVKPEVEMVQYQPKLQEMFRKRSQEAAESEKKKGVTFLDEEAKKPGAVRTPSGLIYQLVKAGTGPMPKPSDVVKVHYHGTLINGSVFDSSVQRGTPAEFPLDRVIPCWTEGVQKMKVGEKAKLICPANLAYGDRGTPGIPGGSTLIFEVELLEIKAPAAPPPPAGLSSPTELPKK